MSCASRMSRSASACTHTHANQHGATCPVLPDFQASRQFGLLWKYFMHTHTYKHTHMEMERPKTEKAQVQKALSAILPEPFWDKGRSDPASICCSSKR
eukprot:1158295-Pelagomonas_calceolata.AAC.2